MILPCCIPVWDFIWSAISPALVSFLQINTEGALVWMRNMIPEVLRFWSTDRALPQASSSRSIIGEEDTLSEIRRLLEKPESNFIGIYGMGGVGKTTLLKAINNEFFQTRSRKFDVVIFVTVSDDVNIEKIQEKIGDRLGFSDDKFPKDPEKRKDILGKSLTEMKFLLLLDDLWGKLDLADVGIPVSLISEKGSKIVFTTRLEDVCNKMYAAGSKVKVQVLNEEKSWKLFCEKLGKRDDEWNDSAKSLAKEVVKKCGGLPLALITVGCAMAGATDDGEWRWALTMLPEDVRTDVLPALKLSFEKLKDRRHQECLLYCALYPEDFNIKVADLIDQWIGEGFLEEERHLPEYQRIREVFPEQEERHLSIDEARDFGLTIITDLKAACLLEDSTERGAHVKLHDMVRVMALWITSGSFQEERNVFLVSNGIKVVEVPRPYRWRDVTRMSLMRTRCWQLPETFECQNLQTLLLNDTSHLKIIPPRFLWSIRRLTVLDLTNAGMEMLPLEIGYLVELRYLNLSKTQVEWLPNEVGNLTNLRILDLNHTLFLRHISEEAISSLTCLQSLNMEESAYDWISAEMDYNAGFPINNAGLKNLDHLRQLNDVRASIVIKSYKDLHGFLRFRRLCSVIRDLRLRVGFISTFDMSRLLGAAEGLKKLAIDGCYDHLEVILLPQNRQTNLEELYIRNFPRAIFSWKDCNTSIREAPKGAPFKNLKVLRLSSCEAVAEITWSREISCLEELYLSNCSEMKVIALCGMDHESSFFFPKLRSITLIGMEKLGSIYGKPLSFCCLQEVVVLGCPRLKRLPFNIDSAENIKEIKGEKEWWNGLKWERDGAQSKFIPYFREITLSDFYTHDYKI